MTEMAFYTRYLTKITEVYEVSLRTSGHFYNQVIYRKRQSSVQLHLHSRYKEFVPGIELSKNIFIHFATY